MDICHNLWVVSYVLVLEGDEREGVEEKMIVEIVKFVIGGVIFAIVLGILIWLLEKKK